MGYTKSREKRVKRGSRGITQQYEGEHGFLL